MEPHPCLRPIPPGFVPLYVLPSFSVNALPPAACPPFSFTYLRSSFQLTSNSSVCDSNSCSLALRIPVRPTRGPPMCYMENYHITPTVPRSPLDGDHESYKTPPQSRSSSVHGCRRMICDRGSAPTPPPDTDIFSTSWQRSQCPWGIGPGSRGRDRAERASSVHSQRKQYKSSKTSLYQQHRKPGQKSRLPDRKGRSPDSPKVAQYCPGQNSPCLLLTSTESKQSRNHVSWQGTMAKSPRRKSHTRGKSGLAGVRTGTGHDCPGGRALDDSQFGLP